jgi:hypothetical protein
MKLSYIKEPKLEFAFGQKEEYPRDGLFLFGPIQDQSLPEVIRYGVIGTQYGLQCFNSWSLSVQGYIGRYRSPLNPEAAHHSSFGFYPISTDS